MVAVIGLGFAAVVGMDFGGVGLLAGAAAAAAAFGTGGLGLDLGCAGGAALAGVGLAFGAACVTVGFSFLNVSDRLGVLSLLGTSFFSAFFSSFFSFFSALFLSSSSFFSFFGRGLSSFFLGVGALGGLGEGLGGLGGVVASLSLAGAGSLALGWESRSMVFCRSALDRRCDVSALLLRRVPGGGADTDPENSTSGGL